MTLVKQRNYELVLPTYYVGVDQDEMEYVDGGGKVGFKVHISEGVANLGGIVGGSVVLGACEAAIGELNLAGPIGISAATAISGIAAGLAGWAISAGLREVDIVIDIPFIPAYVKAIHV